MAELNASTVQSTRTMQPAGHEAHEALRCDAPVSPATSAVARPAAHPYLQGFKKVKIWDMRRTKVHPVFRGG
jgi:hypothetical protein